MVRLLDNLPEKESSTASQCTPPAQSSSTSIREIDSVPRNLLSASNCTKPTSVPSLDLCSDSNSSSLPHCDSNMSVDISFSVQSMSMSNQLQTCVSNTEQSRVVKVSTYHRTSACIAAQNGLHPMICGQFYSVCLASQPSSQSNASVRQLSHSRPDVGITTDILPSCVTNSYSRGRPMPSNSGRTEPSCITTPSSYGRGGLSAFDSNRSHCVQLESVKALDIPLPRSSAHWHSHSNTSSRILTISDSQRTQTTKLTSTHTDSDWITSRS